MQSDFLVIGTGIAGLSFALHAAKHGKVTILTKGEAELSNTAWAQGGISAVLPENIQTIKDDYAGHISDTLNAGAGLCNKEIVEQIVGEGASTIDELVKFGVKFDRDSENPDLYALGKEGGHEKRRVLHSKDTTGRAIITTLLQKVREHPNIEIKEHQFAIDFITTAKLGVTTENRVLGVYALDVQSSKVEVYESNHVILATGGCGKVYLYTTNPDNATGDGLAMAWRAGATISNMEFVQFHPTCFYNPSATDPESRSFLVSEAVRGEGAVLINTKGEDFTKEHDPRGSLAPRDIVARAIDHEIKKTGAQCVYLDVTHKPKGFMEERFPNIYQTLLKFGIDCEKQPIPVVPAAHYQCGGVVTNGDGETSIEGLYAIGEVACTGFHGANRLASNSLLEGNVLARRACQAILQRNLIGKESQISLPIPEWKHGDSTPDHEHVLIFHTWDEIRRLMWNYVSIVRTDNRLKRASCRLRNIESEVQEFYWGHRVNPDLLELRNLVMVASLIVDCAVQRKESRGIHYTLDYPEKDENYLKDSKMKKFF